MSYRHTKHKTLNTKHQTPRGGNEKGANHVSKSNFVGSLFFLSFIILASDCFVPADQYGYGIHFNISIIEDAGDRTSGAVGLNLFHHYGGHILFGHGYTR